MNTDPPIGWNWGSVEVVSTESTGNSYQPDIVVDSEGDIHVAWSDSTDILSSGSDSDVFYKKWNSSSKTWETTELISINSAGNAGEARIAVDFFGNIHVVWQDPTAYVNAGSDFDICYSKRNNVTHTWSKTSIVSSTSTDYSQESCIGADSDGNIHVIWSDVTDIDGSGTDADLFHRYWDVTTSSWSTVEVVTSDSSEASYSPDLVIDSAGNVHITWVDQTEFFNSGTDPDVYYNRYSMSLIGWSAKKLISGNSSDYSRNPAISVTPQRVPSIVWCDEDATMCNAGSDKDIFFRSKDPYSDIWSNTLLMSKDSNDSSLYPSIAIDNDYNTHIAWQESDAYEGSGTDTDIFYNMWNNTDDTWRNLDLISSESFSACTYPEITTDQYGYIHVVWVDGSNLDNAGSDNDIFYKRFSGVPYAPILDAIGPNPSTDGKVYLYWEKSFGAENYSIYRDTSIIISLTGLTPIRKTTDLNSSDTLVTSGTYYYVVTASNSEGEGSISNCEPVVVNLGDESSSSDTSDSSSSSSTPTSGTTSGFGYLLALLIFSLLVRLKIVKRKKKKKEII